MTGHSYKCKRHGEMLLAMSPSEWRRDTGSFVRCPRCGSLLIYRGRVEQASTQSPDQREVGS